MPKQILPWTDERMDLLRKLWIPGGPSASQIARIIGTSRNAVIGKAHKLGLPSKPSPIKRKTVTEKPHGTRANPFYTRSAIMAPISKRHPLYHLCKNPSCEKRIVQITKRENLYCSRECANAMNAIRLRSNKMNDILESVPKQNCCQWTGCGHLALPKMKYCYLVSDWKGHAVRA